MVDLITQQGPIENALLGLWMSALGVLDIHTHTNFFERGGDEAGARQLITNAEGVFNVFLPPDSLERWPTPSLFAQAILQSRVEKGQALPPLVRMSRDMPLPLSFSQERMWFVQQLDPQGTAYNVGGASKLSGPLNHAALQKSLDLVIKKNEILRTVFQVVDGQPMQIILPAMQCPIDWIDLQDEPLPERNQRALSLAEECIRRGFDLEHGPLFYMRAIQLGPEEHVLAANFHHIIVDAWGMSVFTNDLTQFYNAIVHDEDVQLPSNSIQFADYAAWQRRVLSGGRLEKQLVYWRDNLRNVPPFEIPSTQTRPAVQTYQGSLVQTPLQPDSLSAIEKISREENATAFMTLLATFYVLLYRYTGQADITIAVPIANRNWSVTETIIGSLVNTLPIRANLAGNLTFRQVLQNVRKVALEAYDHQEMPYAKIIAELQPERDSSRSPLAQIMFNVINVPFEFPQFEGIKTEFLSTDRLGVQFDLSLNISYFPDWHQANLEYNTDLYDHATVEKMLVHYRNLLDAACIFPDIPVSQLKMLHTEEMEQFARWNATDHDHPVDKTLVQLFAEQVQATPTDVALRCNDLTLSYTELNQRANQVARYLRQCHVQPGDVIGLCFERSLDMVVGLLGIIKAGAAYLPLDPAYPTERLTFMLSDSGARMMVGHALQAGKLAEFCEQVIYLDKDAEIIAKQEKEDLPVLIASKSPLYVLYTSGSTGQPKGVVGSHRAAINRFAWMWRVFPFLPCEVACQKTSLNFVDSVWELFGPLLQGVPSIIIQDEMVKDTPRLVDEIARRGVTRIVLVPSLLKAILETNTNLAQKLPRLSLCICSGEELPVELVKLFYSEMPKSVLLNLYGSSEVAGDVTWYDTRHLPSNLKSVPIGKPVDNTQVYIFDENLFPLPVNIPGEIYVGGNNLAIGYHNRPELTLHKFISEPFHDQPGARLFRTGDLGYFLPDGNIIYLGRRDLQVKVRGIRIELNEIESALLQHPDVRECAVCVSHLDGMSQSLVGFIVPRSNSKIAPEQLRAHLRNRLPENMVPERIVFMAELPSTPNGKLDRKSLQSFHPTTSNIERAVEPARNSLEEKLVLIWEEVLDVRPFGRDDNFFDFGGHSLLAVTLLYRIQQDLGVKLPVQMLFKFPTVAGFAEVIRSGAQQIEWMSIVPIQPHGTRPPFFCVHGFDGGVTGYAKLGRSLGSDQPYYGLQARGLDGKTPPAYSIEEMAGQYIQEIRSEVQPHGPYMLAGYCFGGLVAYEMARQLTALGEQVALVALMDAPINHTREDFLRKLRSPRNVVRLVKNLPHWLDSEIGQRQRRKIRKERFQKADLVGAAKPANHNVESPHQFVIDSSLIYPGLQKVTAAHLKALQNYRPGTYLGRLDIFRVKTSRLSWPFDDDLGWGPFAKGGTDVHLIPGYHDNFLEPPFVQGFAPILRACIDRKISELDSM